MTIIVAVLASLLFAIPAQAASVQQALIVAGADATSDEQQLREIQQGLARAWVQRDRGFIEGVIAPEWTSIQPDGRVLTRLALVGPYFAAVRIDRMVIDDVRVTIVGDTAVVRGRTVTRGSFTG